MLTLTATIIAGLVLLSVGDKEALSLYKSFVDPQSRRQFPFMFTIDEVI